MPKLLPALKFAFWTYFWTLGIFAGCILALSYSERWRHPDDWTWYTIGDDLQGFWFLPLPLLPAALLASLLAPRWWKGLLLLLTPVLLLVWVWSPYRMPLGGIASLTTLILPAAALASVPDFIRSRQGRVA